MATVGSAERLPAATTPITRQVRSITSEDWLAVVIGFLTLLGVIAGLRPQLPALSWATAADLTGKVMNSRNLLTVGTLGILMALLASTRILLMRGSVPRFLAAFPLVYLLGTAAQLVAGSTAVTG